MQRTILSSGQKEQIKHCYINNINQSKASKGLGLSKPTLCKYYAIYKAQGISQLSVQDVLLQVRAA